MTTDLIVFNLEPCKNPKRFKISGQNITTGKGGLLADDLTKGKADAMLNAYQSGAILAGARVSTQRGYK
jgi:hypothetical protein